MNALPQDQSLSTETPLIVMNLESDSGKLHNINKALSADASPVAERQLKDDIKSSPLRSWMKNVSETVKTSKDAGSDSSLASTTVKDVLFPPIQLREDPDDMETRWEPLLNRAPEIRRYHPLPSLSSSSSSSSAFRPSSPPHVSGKTSKSVSFVQEDEESESIVPLPAPRIVSVPPSRWKDLSDDQVLPTTPTRRTSRDLMDLQAAVDHLLLDILEDDEDLEEENR